MKEQMLRSFFRIVTYITAREKDKVSDYDMLVQQLPDVEIDISFKTVWSLVWRSWIPSKVKIFAWRLFKDRLATKEQLAKRGIIELNDNVGCGFGCNSLENSQHLFLFCQIAAGVWGAVYQWLGLHHQSQIVCYMDFLHMVGVLKRNCEKRRASVLWITVCWCIWTHRNNVIFNNGVIDIAEIVQSVKTHSWWWLAISSKHKVSCNYYEWCHSPLDYM
ncbi:uncharacterized protein LOC131598499 [Vicia villosa]|uniref:uncharacterized protein LOC131598499 n=1 Tax=Vicia villosa TaxID=3911 RepID=UPI00273CEF7D|nr:uncharacterized protein LOC131598499 [Vicia villosa]